ncbi:MAG: hypothetical protein JW751_21400 [Polyangiaceae bacterium]|nr:hypothetical protein [Polyangiaceae bacterium]
MATLSTVNARGGQESCARRRGSGWVLAAAWLGIALGGGTARAEAPLPLELRFAGAPGCNDRAALEQEILRRTESLVFATDETETTVVTVRIANGIDRVDATLSIEKAGRTPVMRAVTGRSCEEAIEATGLIIAMLAAPRVEEPATAPPPSPEVAISHTVSPAPAKEVARPTGRAIGWGGGTAALLVAGIAPGTLPAVEGFFDVSTRHQGWSPAGRVVVREGWRAGFALGEGRVAFQLTAAAARICPVALLPSAHLTLRPCLGMTVGSLEATGSRIEGGRSDRYPWTGFGGALRLEARLLPVLFLELEAASEIAGHKSRFSIADTVVHRTSPVTAQAGIGIAVRSPGARRAARRGWPRVATGAGQGSPLPSLPRLARPVDQSGAVAHY